MSEPYGDGTMNDVVEMVPHPNLDLWKTKESGIRCCSYFGRYPPFIRPVADTWMILDILDMCRAGV